MCQEEDLVVGTPSPNRGSPRRWTEWQTDTHALPTPGKPLLNPSMRVHSRAQKNAALDRNSGTIRSRNVARKAFLWSAAGKTCPERPLTEASLPTQAKTLGINTRNRKIHSETFPSHATNLHCAQEPPSGSRKQDRRGGAALPPAFQNSPLQLEIQSQWPRSPRLGP